jgi:hypothetical protein
VSTLCGYGIKNFILLNHHPPIKVPSASHACKRKAHLLTGDREGLHSAYQILFPSSAGCGDMDGDAKLESADLETLILEILQHTLLANACTPASSDSHPSNSIQGVLFTSNIPTVL